MIAANRQAIFRGEDRRVFKAPHDSDRAEGPPAAAWFTRWTEVRQVLTDIGPLPLIIRPAFTLGGTGAGSRTNVEEFETIVQRGLDASPVTEVLIEQSVIGWKEFEMEVMRDKNDNVVIICSIENIDAMGVHTGIRSRARLIQIVLTDKEYQRMRDASIAVIRAVGVETGGSNIQFAINPDNGDMIVVEMNPARVEVFGVGVEGDGVSDREIGGEAGGGILVGRAAELHHQPEGKGGGWQV